MTSYSFTSSNGISNLGKLLLGLNWQTFFWANVNVLGHRSCLSCTQKSL